MRSYARGHADAPAQREGDLEPVEQARGGPGEDPVPVAVALGLDQVEALLVSREPLPVLGARERAGRGRGEPAGLVSRPQCGGASRGVGRDEATCALGGLDGALNLCVDGSAHGAPRAVDGRGLQGYRPGSSSFCGNLSGCPTGT